MNAKKFDCCTPVPIATFKDEDLISVGYRHMCWRYAGAIEYVEIRDWLRGRS